MDVDQELVQETIEELESEMNRCTWCDDRPCMHCENRRQLLDKWAVAVEQEEAAELAFVLTMVTK